MLKISKAFRSNRLLKGLTGVTKHEFSQLLPVFTKVFKEITGKGFLSKPRKRKPGGGRRHTLSTTEEKLFFILFYLKCYPTFDLLGFIFGVDSSQPNRWVPKLLIVLEKSLDRTLDLPKRKISNWNELLEICPEIKDIFVDVTESRTQRPKDSKKQRDHYSGKKKCHTQKYLVINDERKRIAYMKGSYPGKEHDWPILQKAKFLEKVPSEVGIWVDKGFQGIKNKYPELSVEMPHKKPKGQELSKGQKEENQVIAGIRIISEHAIGGAKRLRSVTDVFRNKKYYLQEKFMLLACGIWNHHLKYS